jgi:broad specificity phosphatase PhoE
MTNEGMPPKARTGARDDDRSARLTLLAAAPTAATAAAAVPADEPLDARGRRWAADARGRVPRADRVRCAPDRASRETAAALDLMPQVDAEVRGWDLGRWAGVKLDELTAQRPADVTAWLTDPAAAPHGGEPLTALLARVRGWLAGVLPGHTVVLCGPAVVRAAVVVVLGAPAAAFWRVDVAPLTVTDLRGGPARWTIRAVGAPLRDAERGLERL